MSAVALIEDLCINDVIELAWTLEPRDPMLGLRFTAFYAFAWSFKDNLSENTIELRTRHGLPTWGLAVRPRLTNSPMAHTDSFLQSRLLKARKSVSNHGLCGIR